MIVRHHQTETTWSEAVYSPCARYRYSLTRIWDDRAARLLFVMLNPSTASERRNDPTIERCERRARALAFGALRVVNLFAFRATRPRDLRAAAEPEGPGNASALQDGAAWADRIICGWGAAGTLRQRGPAVAELLRGTGHDLYHLGLTRHGQPRHPLYVAYAIAPQPWRDQAA